MHTHQSTHQGADKNGIESSGQRYLHNMPFIESVVRSSKELALIVTGIAIGAVLLYVSSLTAYTPNSCGGCSAWGLPLYWSINATGTGGGFSLTSFALDLIFWLGLSLTVVEVSFHVAVSYTRQRLKGSV